MFNSPFDTEQEQNKFDFDAFDRSQVIFVADMYSADYTGGAELTTDAIIESSPVNCFRLRSSELCVELIQRATDKHWVFCNYNGMDPKLIPVVIANKSMIYNNNFNINTFIDDKMHEGMGT